MGKIVVKNLWSVVVPLLRKIRLECSFFFLPLTIPPHPYLFSPSYNPPSPLLELGRACICKARKIFQKATPSLGAPLFLLLSFLLLPLSLHAASASFRTEEAHVSLTPVSYQGEVAQFLLTIDLAQGWKTYGAEAGDVGIPLTIDVSRSINLRSHSLFFPPATREEEHAGEMTLVSYVYHDSVSFPLTVTVTDSSEALSLAASVYASVCEKICIPLSGELAFTLTPGFLDPKALARFEAASYLTDSSSHAPSLPSSASLDTFLWMMVLAFAGGLILNAMPCVLPVLSIKLLGVLQHGGKDRAYITQSFSASIAGILVSFLALALLFLLFKEAGMHVGWGFQFQNAQFLLCLSAVLVAFSASLFGWFYVSLPSFLSAPFLSSRAQDSSLAGHFWSGVLAVVLATPCTAPIVGTAVGFALAQDSWRMVVLLLTMGFGLAFPYVLILFFPRCISALPKPGAWMLKVKVILGVGVFCTALWLLWIVRQQLSFLALSAWSGMLLAWLGFVWSRRHFVNTRRVVFLLLCLLALGVMIPVFSTAPAATSSPLSSDSIWRPWSPEAVETARRSGNIVVVDVTADWCLTCKVNEAFILNRSPVLEWLAAPDVILFKADWTQRDARITEFLAQHNRRGIPFVIVYRPDRPEAIVLPELLSREAIAHALGK